MTARDLKRYTPGAYDPTEHNRTVHRRKEFRALLADTAAYVATFVRRNNSAGDAIRHRDATRRRLAR